MNKEISAEMLLGHLYPELELLWTVRHRGTFYRNYSPDVMDIDEENMSVDIARDGLLKLIPPALLTGDFELTNTDAKGKNHTTSFKSRYEAMKQRLHLLDEAFLPIDTFRFRTRLATEHHLEDILAIKVEHVLKEYYGIDLSTVTDELVKKAAMLMPYLNKRRGDVRYVKRILETIAGHKVRMRQSAYSDTDNSRYWIQKVDFDIHVDGLDTESYRKEETRLKPLTEFLSEYFIPVDIICNFNIVGKNKENKLLNYNSNVL